MESSQIFTPISSVGQVSSG